LGFKPVAAKPDILGVVERSLQQLAAAVQGLVVMSVELEVMYTGLLNNQVPRAWHAVAYLSLKPLGSWVTDFHRKFRFMRMWLANGAPKSFWLPGFFFPQVGAHHQADPPRNAPTVVRCLDSVDNIKTLSRLVASSSRPATPTRRSRK
jgi:hypothetical protein